MKTLAQWWAGIAAAGERIPAHAGELAAAATAGLLAGWLVDRAVRRLSLEQSLLWPPADHCPRCHAALPGLAHLPLVGPLLARRCGGCRQGTAKRGLALQLLCAVGVAALYFWFVIAGPAAVLPERAGSGGFYAHHLFALWVTHSLLFCLLVTATFIDLDLMIIPDSVTVPGMLAGVLLGAFWYIELHPVALWQTTVGGWPPPADLFEENQWRAWFGSRPARNAAPQLAPWLEAFRQDWYWRWRLNWNWVVGLATGVVGLLVGMGTVQSVRLVCSWAFGREAIGFGDVTLMGMVGAFLGWQTVVVAFFLAPLSGIVVGGPLFFVAGRNMFAFGPHLAIGSLLAVFFWQPIWQETSILFINQGLAMYLGGFLLAALAGTSLAVAAAKRALLGKDA